MVKLDQERLLQFKDLSMNKMKLLMKTWEEYFQDVSLSYFQKLRECLKKMKQLSFLFDVPICKFTMKKYQICLIRTPRIYKFERISRREFMWKDLLKKLYNQQKKFMILWKEELEIDMLEQQIWILKVLDLTLFWQLKLSQKLWMVVSGMSRSPSFI